MSGRPFGYGHRWRKVSALAIARQPWCSDCGSTADLTGDHVIPVSHGGLSTIANVDVRCRSCNARRQDRQLVVTQLTLDAALQRDTAA